MTYYNILIKSWNQLIRLKKFRPEQESDIQCMLYHFLLKNGIKAGNIFNNHTIKGCRVDMLLWEKKRKFS